jgi:hypothetical protein
MITHEERRRLVEAYGYEPFHVIGTLLKCAICLLIIGGLVVMGISYDADRSASLAAAWSE